MENKEYPFLLNNIEYSIIIKIENNRFIIEAKEKKEDIPFYYKTDLIFEDIKKMDNIFLNMNSLEEIKIFFQNILAQKENIIGEIEESEEHIIISIKYNFFSLIKTLKISLKRIILSDKKMIEYLTNQNILLKKEITELKNKINSNGKDNDSYKISTLIKNENELNLIKSGIVNCKNKNLKLKLLYRASIDGDTPEIFHSKCDGISPTISIFKTSDNYTFGGYSDAKWDKISSEKKGNNIFLFSFNNMKLYPGKNGGSIYCSSLHGPWFSWAIGVYNNSFLKEKEQYRFDFNTIKQYWNNFDKEYEITGEKKKFYIKEIEVFHIEII